MPVDTATLGQLLRVTRAHGYGAVSTGEQLFGALVRNRAPLADRGALHERRSARAPRLRLGAGDPAAARPLGDE